MPELTIRVGGKSYLVACQAGEETYLESAAALLDAEAQSLIHQIRQLPENRMLLMAGLMLADKTAALEEKSPSDGAQTAAMTARIAELEAELAALRSRPPEQVRVPYVPDSVSEQFANLSAHAEALADRLDEKLASSPTAQTDDS